MNDNRDITDMIPLLVAGKLDAAQKDRTLAEIQKSPQLKKEWEFWKGVYLIRKTMPLYDSLDHIASETLDRLARGEISKFSDEFSEISSHLTTCQSCIEDLKLLRDALQLLPEEKPATAAIQVTGWRERFRLVFASPLAALSALVPLILLAFVTFTMFNPGVEQDQVATFLLQPQFEKRNISADGQIPEQGFVLNKSTRKIAFQFVTDRIDIADYRYSIDITPRGAQPVALPGETINCYEQTESTNSCQVIVSDPGVVGLLRHGGSFSISIKEVLPVGVDLEPAEYEYYFRVLLKD